MTAVTAVSGTAMANNAFERLVCTTALRGDSSRFRENTLPAIASAIYSGAEFVEVDVRITQDEVVVLLRDDTLERLWGLDQRVGDLDWVDLARLGSGEEQIPRLRDALELFSDAASVLVIDMDEESPARAAIRAVLDSDVDVAWCGDLASLRTIRSLDSAARIWMPWDEHESPPAELLAEFRPQFVNADFRVLSQRLVDDVHALGGAVSCWTVDDEEDMRAVLRMGVDAVTTNRLTLLQEVCEASECWQLDDPGPAAAAAYLGDDDGLTEPVVEAVV